MNLLATRIGLGIAIYLSSSTIYTHPSFAVSLKFSDRYELTQLNEPIFSTIEPDLVDNSVSEVNGAEYFNLDFQPQPQLLEPTLSSIQQPSIATTPTESLFAPESQIRVQIGSDEEEGNLLDYIVGAFSNLQINSINNNSFANPNVVILPQVAYGDLYRGLYDFEVDVTANPNPSATTPRSANNSIPEELLVTRESVRNYNPSFIPTGFSSNRNDFLLPTNYTSSVSSLFGGTTTPSENNSSPSSFLYTPYLSSRNINSFVGSYEDRDMSTRISEILSQNVNVYTNTEEEIEVESNYRYQSASDKFNEQKDPMQLELEQELQQREIRRKQKRQNLMMKLQQEQRKREMKRKQEQITTTRKRNNRLRRARQKQQQTLRKQQQTLGNQF